MDKNWYIDLIKTAYNEDLGAAGDITSQAIFTEETAEFTLNSKDQGILAGMEIFKESFYMLDKAVSIQEFYYDGDILEPGFKVAKVKGKVLSVLTAERIALNFLSTLSGMASRTRQFVAAAKEGGNAIILDTRKTLPGYRYISKYAAKVGGAQNHRMGLYDMILIKDNHIDAAGGITRAVELARKRWAGQFKIEVECRNLADVKEALACRVDIIMLDNMNLSQMKEAVQFVNKRIKLEASGNITLDRVKDISSTGVDYISVGSITKSVKAFDFSLKKDKT